MIETIQLKFPHIQILSKKSKIKIRIYSTPDQWFGVTNLNDEAIVKKRIEEYENL